ncbi:MAG: hypothetical protein MSA50_08470 [Veillonellaceae bacterium]|uniref:hypothetical protein n=1 Tax=uncultured Selenomonas sp. TaxID=159275 RepID=UPI0025DC3DF4|nr:hypothetical protein [uncultured Selenomonas sp.]MCI7540606.1 hypothetical protein [Veillonellaceae bacterium]
MSSEQKRQLKRLEKREQDGWPCLVTLKDIYPFEMFLESRGWHSAVTRGNELLRVYLPNSPKEIIVKYNEARRWTTVNCRHGMALWYAYDIFHREEWRKTV